MTGEITRLILLNLMKGTDFRVATSMTDLLSIPLELTLPWI